MGQVVDLHARDHRSVVVDRGNVAHGGWWAWVDVGDVDSACVDHGEEKITGSRRRQSQLNASLEEAGVRPELR